MQNSPTKACDPLLALRKQRNGLYWTFSLLTPRASRMLVYLAAPVFTLAERRFNEELAVELERLCPSLQVFLPQRYDKEFQGAPDFSPRMFASLMGALDRCDVVLAVLDGPDADSGTSFEMGYARGQGKKVIGIRTDFRGGEDHGLNLMLSNGCSELITEPSTTTTLGRLAARIVRVLGAGEEAAPGPTNDGTLL
jgi:nucleoside 2-deoxyribosyltransferase